MRTARFGLGSAAVLIAASPAFARSDPCIDTIVRNDCEALQGDAIFQGIGSVCGECPFYGPDGWVIAPVVTTAFVDPYLPVALGGVPCGSAYELTVTCLACPVVAGDVSGDGYVTFADILIVLANWGGMGPDGDANCDGIVTFQDLIVILTEWTG